MSRGASLRATLTSAPGWTQIVDCDGSSTAGFSVRSGAPPAGTLWTSNGSEIEVFAQGGYGFPESSWFLDEAGDDLSPLISVQVDVWLPGQSVYTAQAGVGLFNDPTALYPDDGASSFLQVTSGNFSDYDVAASNGFYITTTIPVETWVTLRMDCAFGVARCIVDGVDYGSVWLGNQPWAPERLTGWAAAYPALMAVCNPLGLGPQFRNFKAWNTNTGPFV